MGSIASTYVRRDGRWQLALSAHQPWKPNGKTAAEPSEALSSEG